MTYIKGSVEMKFRYGKNDFKSLERGNELCYLLTNGLGGFSSTSIINSVTRNDHALFMACIKAPNYRVNMISKMDEELILNKDRVTLSSQQYATPTKNKEGYRHLHSFSQEYLPEWTYFYDGVEIKKTIVYEHSKNTLGVKYTVHNASNHEASLELTPVLQFVPINDIIATPLGKDVKVPVEYTITEDRITGNSYDMSVQTNATKTTINKPKFESDIYFAHDARAGRNAVGCGSTAVVYTCTIPAKTDAEFHVIFSLEDTPSSDINAMISSEVDRQKELITNAQYDNPIAQSLVRASDQFISHRESTNAKTIMAGYPWFTDWGRDTMFAVLGSCISTKRYEDAREIFKTFIAHIDKGLMPNLFPEGTNNPMYNTVDASLLYIYAIYEYYIASGDLDFVRDLAFEPMLEIIHWYKKGTDFNIYMDDDYLIYAGQGYDQVTWMDVRFEEILPTARHGKPVEINAFWYNALKVVAFFSEKLGKDGSEFEALSEKVKENYEPAFWNEEEQCLKDVVSGNDYDTQVRSNQIWAIMMPFSPVSEEKAKLVVDKVYQELYTPYGLRTLSKRDEEFVWEYSGSHFKRDMSYHQGTVWPFPLGGYFIAYLKVNNYSQAAKSRVLEQLECFEDAMREGCVGQIAEIYDGLYPAETRGCFAQAWSVTEILRVYQELDK